jgi:hypothetical protein
MERDRASRPAWAACAGVVLLALGCASALFSAPASASPLLTQRETIEGLVIYPDDKAAHIFYYVPGAIRLATTDDTPQFSFRRMRYVGTKLMGDQGTFRGRGDISFTVEFEDIGEQVRAAHKQLKRRNRRALLLPIPVEKIEAELVYAVIEGGDVQRGERLASGLWAEPPKEPPKEGPSAGQWESKTFDVPLNPRTTQVMWEAYEKGGVLLSLNYAVVAHGVSDLEQLPAEAQRRLDELRRQAEGAVEDDEGAVEDNEGAVEDNEGEGPAEIKLDEIARTVQSGALQIKVLPKKHPECFTSVDLDAEMPAGYVFLEVYCYDFQNDPATAIAKKRVEIRGYGIAGARPKVKVEFNRSAPDETSKEVRFEFAVDLDKGYEYRIVDFDDDGDVTRGDWTAVKDWTGILDVSKEFDLPPPDEADDEASESEDADENAND